MSEKSAATLRRSPPRATPAASAARMAVTVPRETNFISCSRSLSSRIIAFIRAARSPISSRAAHALDAGGEVALPYPLGHGADLQDRAGEAAGEEERGGGGDAEAGEADEEEVAQHVVDDRVGVGLGELGDDRPGEGVREGVGAEHGLAVGPHVALDRLGAGGGDDERRGGGDDGAVGEGSRLELEDGPAAGVDHRDLAAPGEGVVAHQPAERREVDAGGEHDVAPGEPGLERQRHGGEPVAGGLDPAGHELAVAAVAADGVDLAGGGAERVDRVEAGGGEVLGEGLVGDEDGQVRALDG